MNELKEIPSRYIQPKAETDRVSIDESREIPVIDLQELLHGRGGDQMASFHTKMQGPGASFGETIERYVEELQELNLRLLELIAKNLGVDSR
ncbi:hypothetical protein Syun_018276 [Stephania yunnanensis]|uniref:Uncharacterized protein n=1 Tax=Stephania yunnanensis TaxID=152371 RepID=A0AAP0IS04_9MAGN